MQGEVSRGNFEPDASTLNGLEPKRRSRPDLEFARQRINCPEPEHRKLRSSGLRTEDWYQHRPHILERFTWK
jgi:hypothetical protein